MESSISKRRTHNTKGQYTLLAQRLAIQIKVNAALQSIRAVHTKNGVIYFCKNKAVKGLATENAKPTNQDQPTS